MLNGVDVVWFADMVVEEAKKEEYDPMIEHTTQQMLELPEEERDFITLIGERGKHASHTLSFFRVVF